MQLTMLAMTFRRLHHRIPPSFGMERLLSALFDCKRFGAYREIGASLIFCCCAISDRCAISGSQYRERPGFRWSMCTFGVSGSAALLSKAPVAGVPLRPKRYTRDPTPLLPRSIGSAATFWRKGAPRVPLAEHRSPLWKDGHKGRALPDALDHVVRALAVARTRNPWAWLYDFLFMG